jgi:hypothetical protein
MIHTLSVDENFELSALKKEFRKKLMTGGAVIRIAGDVSEQGIERIFLKLEEELVDAAPIKNGIIEEVLKEIVRHRSTSDCIISKITTFENLPNLERELVKRESACAP